MRALLVLGLLGCGRVSFDPLGAADASPRDVLPSGTTTYLTVSSDTGIDASLMTLDLATGELSLLGTISATFGVVGGLAYWDANTLYATTSGGSPMANAISGNLLLKITLSPFGVTVVGSTLGTYSALERDGTMLFAIDQDADVISLIDPASPDMPSSTHPLLIDAIGGDLAHAAGAWFWFSNTGSQLYRVTFNSAVTAGSSAIGAPFISGMVADDAGNLFVTSGDTDQLYPLDKATGQLGAPIALCMPCPQSPYNLLSGDMTRTP